jgi:hypothetical protein
VAYKDGGWWHWYAGKVDEKTVPASELVAMHMELWEDAAEIQRNSNMKQPDAAAFRETFALVNSLFNTP